MLRIISKQAQLLTVDDDQGLLNPHRQLGRGVKRTVQQIGRGVEQTSRKLLNDSGNFSNGTCWTPGCGQGLVVGPNKRRYCPSCNPPRFSPGTAPPPPPPPPPK